MFPASGAPKRRSNLRFGSYGDTPKKTCDGADRQNKGRVPTKTSQQHQRDATQEQTSPGGQGGRRKQNRCGEDQACYGRVDAAEEAFGTAILTDARILMADDEHQGGPGCEEDCSRHQSARHRSDLISRKRRQHRNRAGRQVADGHAIHEFPLGQVVQLRDQMVVEQGHEDEATPKKDATDLQKRTG